MKEFEVPYDLFPKILKRMDANIQVKRLGDYYPVSENFDGDNSPFENPEHDLTGREFFDYLNLVYVVPDGNTELWMIFTHRGVLTFCSDFTIKFSDKTDDFIELAKQGYVANYYIFGMDVLWYLS